MKKKRNKNKTLLFFHQVCFDVRQMNLVKGGCCDESDVIPPPPPPPGSASGSED